MAPRKYAETDLLRSSFGRHSSFREQALQDFDGFTLGVEGLVIAAATVTAFYLGLNAGGAAAGQTMAFATLCLSRLFHGFSCKSQHPVLLTRHFWNNRALLGAFTIGALLLGLVLLVPALEPLFAVAPLSIGMVGAIVGLAFGSMVVIQLLKLIRQ